MRNLFAVTFVVCLVIQLQGCASSGSNVNTPMAADSSYQSSVSPNMDYMYRSPPPQVTHALTGR